MQQIRAQHALLTLVLAVFFATVCSPAWADPAAAVGERMALVIGNSAYPKAPLLNPANDARAMAALLRQAGFTVNEANDTSQAQLSEAVARFGQAIKDPKVKFGLFYYAGHGIQLEWKNYLVPVSADVRSAADVKAKAVDVSELLAYMEQAKGRSFLVILDACRDDPFAGLYKPSAAGLSQFDAPAGSLLAFSTAPGKVAQDGVGSNGLYTANLLREFSRRGVRLEDAFKRVRLSVRMASNGTQIPWESTSLEEDIFLFPVEQKKLSEAEQDQLLSEELANWQRVRSSRDSIQLASFIAQYPSGSASELAQARLSRLLNEIAVQDGERQRSAVLQAEREEARLEAQKKILVASRHAESVQSQSLAVQRAEDIRKSAQAIAQAQADAERVQMARVAQIQADETRAAEQQLQANKARQAALEVERLAAVKAAQQAELAKAEAAKITQARQDAQRLEAAQLQAQQQMQAQAAAVARAQDIEREDQAKARRAEQQRVADAAQEAQKQRTAQLELAHLAEEKQKFDALLAVAQLKLQTAAQATPAVQPTQGLAATPYFKGFQEHQRTFQKGDFFNYQVIDGFSKVARPLNLQVTEVNVDADRVEYNGGEYASDTMGNTLVNPRGGFDTPRQFYPAELFVGKKWISVFRQSRPGGVRYTFNYTLKVVARERITVPAGTFDTFKIEARGFNMQLGARLERNIWVAPGVSGDIAHETLVRLRNGSIEQNDRQELVSFNQASLRTASR